MSAYLMQASCFPDLISMQIIPEFMNKQKKNGEHSDHAVWLEVKPPEKLAIHGTNAASIGPRLPEDTVNNLELQERRIFRTRYS